MSVVVGGVRLRRAPPGCRSTDCRASASRSRPKRVSERRQATQNRLGDVSGGHGRPLLDRADDVEDVRIEACLDLAPAHLEPLEAQYAEADGDIEGVRGQ